MRLYKRVAGALACAVAMGTFVGFGNHQLVANDTYQGEELGIEADVRTTGSAITIQPEVTTRQSYTFTESYINMGTGTIKEGSIKVENGQLTVGATGGKMEKTQDDVYFAYIPVAGDFTMTAKVSSNVARSGNFRANLMVRNGIKGDAPHVSVGFYKTATGGYYFSRLSEVKNGGLSSVTEVPVYLRLERKGTTYSMYVSQDGIFNSKPDKTYTDSVTMGNEGSTLNVGIAVCEGETVFDELLLVDGQGQKIYDLADAEDSGSVGKPTMTGITPFEDITVLQGEAVVLPVEAKVNYSDQTSKQVEVVWSQEVVDTSEVGIQIITGTVTVDDEIKEVVVKVIVKEKPVVIGVMQPADITVTEGKKVNLPETVKVNYSDGTSEDKVVIWEKTEVDTTMLGEQVFSGTVTIDEKVWEVTLKIIVTEKQADVMPANIQLTAEKKYVIGEDYKLEVLSNEAGTIEIEVNGEVINTGVLVPSGTAFKYEYILPGVENETLEIFATVTDEADNTATVYHYAVGERVFSGKTLLIQDEQGNAVTSLQSGQGIYAKAQVRNTEGRAANYTVIVALYDENNQLVEKNSSTESLAANESVELITMLTIPENIEGYQLKVFLWDALEGTVAYTDPKIIK